MSHRPCFPLDWLSHQGRNLAHWRLHLDSLTKTKRGLIDQPLIQPVTKMELRNRWWPLDRKGRLLRRIVGRGGGGGEEEGLLHWICDAFSQWQLVQTSIRFNWYLLSDALPWRRNWFTHTHTQKELETPSTSILFRSLLKHKTKHKTTRAAVSRVSSLSGDSPIRSQPGEMVQTEYSGWIERIGAAGQQPLAGYRYQRRSRAGLLLFSFDKLLVDIQHGGLGACWNRQVQTSGLMRGGRWG